MNFEKALQEVREKSKKRKFVQSVDLMINFTDIDFNKPENKLSLEIALPKGRGKRARVALILSDKLVAEAKKYDARVIEKAELEKLGADKKELKKVAQGYDFFFAQPELMPLVGKTLGQILGPRGKMPKPLLPNVDFGHLLKMYESAVRIKTTGKALPTVHASVGTEDMADADLVQNLNAAMDAVLKKMPRGKENIKSVFLKMTMGPAIKVSENGVK